MLPDAKSIYLNVHMRDVYAKLIADFNQEETFGARSSRQSNRGLKTVDQQRGGDSSHAQLFLDTCRAVVHGNYFVTSRAGTGGVVL